MDYNKLIKQANEKLKGRPLRAALTMIEEAEKIDTLIHTVPEDDQVIWNRKVKLIGVDPSALLMGNSLDVAKRMLVKQNCTHYTIASYENGMVTINGGEKKSNSKSSAAHQTTDSEAAETQS